MAVKSLQALSTQHVRISYEIANLGNRFAAAIIDFIVMVAYNAIVVSLFASLIGEIVSDPGIYLLTYYLLFVPLFFYTPLMEVLMNGQTPGKKALNIQVRTIDGRNPSLVDLFIRWAFRLLDIWFTFASLGTVLIVSGDRAQRLGGRLSNTVVVKLKPSKHLNLEGLMSIARKDEKAVRFPQVRQLEEQELLVLKSTLERYNNYKNEAHRKALLMACERVRELINVDSSGLMPTQFIETLIQDYIVLTR